MRENWFTRNLSTILTILGSGGMVTTTILAVKATPEADKELQKYEDPKDILRVAWKHYRIPIGIGFGSLACIFGANAFSRRQQASLASAYTVLATTYESYRDKIRLTCGKDIDEAIEHTVEQEKEDKENGRPPWDQVQTFYIEGYGRPQFFDRTMEQVVLAEYALNRIFALKGIVTFNDFLKLLDLVGTPKDDKIGWEEFAGDSLFGYHWIDFAHHYISADDGLVVCEISFPFEPHSLDAYDEAFDRAIGNHIFGPDDEKLVREKNKG